MGVIQSYDDSSEAYLVNGKKAILKFNADHTNARKNMLNSEEQCNYNYDYTMNEIILVTKFVFNYHGQGCQKQGKFLNRPTLKMIFKGDIPTY